MSNMNSVQIIEQIAISREERRIRNIKSAIFAGATASNGLMVAVESGYTQAFAIVGTVISGYVTLVNLVESSRQSGVIEAYENVLGETSPNAKEIYDLEAEPSV